MVLLNIIGSTLYSDISLFVLFPTMLQHDDHDPNIEISNSLEKEFPANFRFLLDPLYVAYCISKYATLIDHLG